MPKEQKLEPLEVQTGFNGPASPVSPTNPTVSPCPRAPTGTESGRGEPGQSGRAGCLGAKPLFTARAALLRARGAAGRRGEEQQARSWGFHHSKRKPSQQAPPGVTARAPRVELGRRLWPALGNGRGLGRAGLDARRDDTRLLSRSPSVRSALTHRDASLPANPAKPTAFEVTANKCVHGLKPHNDPERAVLKPPGTLASHILLWTRGQ